LFSKAEIRNFLTKLIYTAIKGKSGSLYASLESINRILNEYPYFINRTIYEKLFPLFKKILRKKALFYPSKRDFIKISISFINLILKFEKDFSDISYIENLKNLINKMVSKIDHADIKYLLEIIDTILKKTSNIPKIEVIRPIFGILRDLHNKKDRIDDYINNLIIGIIEIIWPSLNDSEKDLFFQETHFGDSIL